MASNTNTNNANSTNSTNATGLAPSRTYSNSTVNK